MEQLEDIMTMSGRAAHLAAPLECGIPPFIPLTQEQLPPPALHAQPELELPTLIFYSFIQRWASF